MFIYTVELLIRTGTVSNAGYISQIQGVIFLITWLRAAERATSLLRSDQIMTPALQCSLLYNTALKLLRKLKDFDLQKYKLKMPLHLQHQQETYLFLAHMLFRWAVENTEIEGIFCFSTHIAA